MKGKYNQTKKDLMEAFWKLYCEKRIEKITVKEVVQLAGYNRSTFYEYFVDIYDVLEQIEKDLIPSMDELPPISLLNVELGMPLNLFMNLYEQQSDYYFVLLGEKGDPAFAGKLKFAIKEMLQDVFSGEEHVDLIELDYVLEFVLSGMIGVMTYWFKQGKKLPAEELIQIIHQLMERGVTSTLK